MRIIRGVQNKFFFSLFLVVSSCIALWCYKIYVRKCNFTWNWINLSNADTSTRSIISRSEVIYTCKKNFMLCFTPYQHPHSLVFSHFSGFFGLLFMSVFKKSFFLFMRENIGGIYRWFLMRMSSHEDCLFFMYESFWS